MYLFCMVLLINYGCQQEEACYPGENIVCLFMDLMDNHAYPA